MDSPNISFTPEQVSEAVRTYVYARLSEVAPAGDWSQCNGRFAWCGDVLDFLADGLEQHVARLGLTFRDAFPGPLRLWDEDQHPNGEHARRFWTIAFDSASGQPLAKLCTIFFHRHDCVALPRPPQIVAFPPDFRVDDEDGAPWTMSR